MPQRLERHDHGGKTRWLERGEGRHALAAFVEQLADRRFNVLGPDIREARERRVGEQRIGRRGGRLGGD